MNIPLRFELFYFGVGSHLFQFLPFLSCPAGSFNYTPDWKENPNPRGGSTVRFLQPPEARCRIPMKKN